MTKKRRENTGFEDRKGPVFLNQKAADLICVAGDVEVEAGCLSDFWFVLWGRLTAAALLAFDFLPFYRVAFETRNQIKCKQDEDKGKEGRMSSVGGGSNPLCCLPYMAFITATNVGGKTNCLTQLDAKKDKSTP